MSSTDLRSHDGKVCPACDGAGGGDATYAFKPRHRYDFGDGPLTHFETCQICRGRGQCADAEQVIRQILQAGPTCPACGGAGGKRFWSWNETPQPDERTFTFVPCKLCQGHGHVSVEVKATYERERRRWQLGTLAMTLAVGVGGLWLVTRLATAVVSSPHWLLCCPQPQFLFAGGLAALYLVRKSLL